MSKRRQDTRPETLPPLHTRTHRRLSHQKDQSPGSIERAGSNSVPTVIAQVTRRLLWGDTPLTSHRKHRYHRGPTLRRRKFRFMAYPDGFHGSAVRMVAMWEKLERSLFSTNHRCEGFRCESPYYDPASGLDSDARQVYLGPSMISALSGKSREDDPAFTL